MNNVRMFLEILQLVQELRLKLKNMKINFINVVYSILMLRSGIICQDLVLMKRHC